MNQSEHRSSRTGSSVRQNNGRKSFTRSSDRSPSTSSRSGGFRSGGSFGTDRPRHTNSGRSDASRPQRNIRSTGSRGSFQSSRPQSGRNGGGRGRFQKTFDVSKFINHSTEPTVKQNPDYKDAYLITTHKIKSGEELTQNYLEFESREDLQKRGIKVSS